jgi:hypothetical protein
MRSLPLDVDGVDAGALNIYALTPGGFEADVIDVAFELAQYTGVVAAATDGRNRSRVRAEQLQQAMQSRAVIEQAKGVVMGQRRRTAHEAFQILVRLSQDSHRKLRDVALAIVDDVTRG